MTPDTRNEITSLENHQGRVTRLEIPLERRAAFTPLEFAGMFGHPGNWAYRKIYKQQVKVISTLGRIMIPRSEVERLLSEASPYAGGIAAKRPKRSVQ